ncbi:hypothetical protein HPB48_009590 [Haemaphysalis longicornis]|uniref:SWIM-type domain-containing protein n=1 Tax=Haemaphysalis longicornis TaxID=44386 RepID=A0A9J6FDI6_HAELO|nr:hypothetical protein HPB48_009590 [Haemaphysalis longicornis]
MFTGPQFFMNSLNNTTNNRLEAINDKLKSVIKPHTSLEEFLPALFAVQHALPDERDQKAVNSVYKRPTCPERDTDKSCYQPALTTYAFEFVKKHHEWSKKITFEQTGQTFTSKCSSGDTLTALTDCNCSFRLSMLLPCRHMFAVRQKISLPLFE